MSVCMCFLVCSYASVIIYGQRSTSLVCRIVKGDV